MARLALSQLHYNVVSFVLTSVRIFSHALDVLQLVCITYLKNKILETIFYDSQNKIRFIDRYINLTLR